MGTTRSIPIRILLTSCWVLLGASIVLLLLASTRVQQTHTCTAVEVRITSAATVFHFSKQDVLRKISGNHPELLVGAQVRTFDLRQLEQLLEQDLWVRNAELYFDHNQVLHVQVEERRPVARVFTDGGTTFYVDDMGMQLPISQQAAHVPVFTSLPLDNKKKVDSILLAQVRDMGLFLMTHDFWQAQIEQVHLNGMEMELFPKLGMHTILFGTATDVEKKFKRLELFYNRILRKVGWNFYSLVDLRFDKQLIATRRDSTRLFASFVLPHDSLDINHLNDRMAGVRPDSITNTRPAVAESPFSELPVSKVKQAAEPASDTKVAAKQDAQNTAEKKPLSDQATGNIKKPVINSQQQKIKETTKKQRTDINNRQPKALMPKQDIPQQ